jgi:precorrin-8X/cobalt-precorrin-8 methylmutase
MTMPLFDRYLAVDWSANNSRKLGKDSIWSCVADSATDDVRTRNHPTRRRAESWLLQQLMTAVAAGERVLAGMDFPYGYPAGFAAALGLRGDPWRATWGYLTDHVVDDHDNRSNRFEVASDINLALGRRAPFWGRPQHLALPGLSARKDVAYRDVEQLDQLPEWRKVERTLRDRGASPQPAWKLAYTGSVGSQTLVGIPVVYRLRNHEALRDVSRVWPFEVLVPELPTGAPAVVHAEIWPSIVAFAHEAGSCADERQVRAVVRAWRELDRRDRLATWFAAPPDAKTVRAEEGWVLGVEPPGSNRRFGRPRPPRIRSATESGRQAPATRPGEPANALGRPPCLCGCGLHPRGRHSRFMPGHDQRINPATGRRFNDH